MIKHAFALVSVITRVFYLHSTALMSMFRRIYNAIMNSYHKPLPLSWNSLHFLLMGPQVPCSHLHDSTDTAIVGLHLSLSPNISWASSEHGPIIFNRALVSNIAWAHKSCPSGIFFFLVFFPFIKYVLWGACHSARCWECSRSSWAHSERLWISRAQP